MSPKTNSPSPAQRSAWAGALALGLWVVPLLVIVGLVIARPMHRSVTPAYHSAVENWWAHKDIYTGFSFHYLPQFVVLFTPFHLLPPRVGEVLWRLLAAGVLTGGLWRFSSTAAGEGGPKRFLQVTIVALPLCLPALQNGQANAHLSGLFLLATAGLMRKEWWLATGCMVLAVAIKQFSIVMVLLALVVYAPLRWRLLVGFLALALLPFLCGPTDYVLGQYRAALTHLQACATVTDNRFADLSGIVRTFGAELPAEISKWIRVLAGGMTMLGWWLGARNLAEPLRAPWLYALLTGYLMVFNPMTEANSYVILAPALGLWAAWAWEQTGTRNLGWLLAAMCLSMGLLPNLLRPIFGSYFALFWHPLMTLLFLGLLTAILRPWRSCAPGLEALPMKLLSRRQLSDHRVSETSISASPSTSQAHPGNAN